MLVKPGFGWSLGVYAIDNFFNDHRVHFVWYIVCLIANSRIIKENSCKIRLVS